MLLSESRRLRPHLGSQKLPMFSSWLMHPPPPTPHTGLANDGLWSWRLAPRAGQHSAWERRGRGSLGKAPEGAGVGAQDLPGRPGQPCSLAVWKPRGSGGGGGSLPLSPLAPLFMSPQAPGLPCGNRASQECCLFSLKSSLWSSDLPLFYFCVLFSSLSFSHRHSGLLFPILTT